MAPRLAEAARGRLLALIDAPPVAALMAFLNPPGEETRIVGGAVRNVLIDQPISDIDLATTLLPEAVMRIAAMQGWRAVPTGIEHGTVTLVDEGRGFEVTTLREDIATDGRHAEVRFGRDFREDAARRDFTINALSVGRDGIVQDYFGGLDDLAARRVRFIGAAEQRIQEDYLRSLRFFRFSATYGETLDPVGLKAVLDHRAGLSRLSRERIRQEMLKLVMAPRALPVLLVAESYGLIGEILGVPVFPDGLAARLAFAERHGETVGLLPRLAALTMPDETSLARLRDSLRLTNAEEKWLSGLIEARRMLREARYDAGAMFTLGQIYPETGPEALRLAAIETGDDALLVHLPQVEHPPVFHLTGKDVLALGVAAGPRVGQLLAAAKAAWGARGCPPEMDAQRAILAETYAASA